MGESGGGEEVKNWRCNACNMFWSRWVGDKESGVPFRTLNDPNLEYCPKCGIEIKEESVEYC